MQPTPPAAARAKTHRRRGPSTPAIETAGPFVSDSVAKSTEDSLDALFAAESAANFNQPWQKLDRGARLDRLRKFVQSYPDLSPAEATSLLAAVLQAYETKQLNTKLAVEYDPVAAKIVGIRGLKERVGLSGLRTFRIESAVARATIRRAKSVPPQDLNIANPVTQ